MCEAQNADFLEYSRFKLEEDDFNRDEVSVDCNVFSSVVPNLGRGLRRNSKHREVKLRLEVIFKMTCANSHGFS